MRIELEAARKVLDATQTRLRATKSELARQVDDLQRLHTLGMRLSTHVELSTLLEEVLTAVCALQAAPVGLLMLFDNDQRELYTVATIGLELGQIKKLPRLPLGTGPCGLAVSERRPVAIKDIRRDRGVVKDPAFAEAAGYRAMSCFPLQARTGQIVGAIATYFLKPRALSPRETQLVELYGAQAAEFIENAKSVRKFARGQPLERRIPGDTLPRNSDAAQRRFGVDARVASHGEWAW